MSSDDIGYHIDILTDVWYRRSAYECRRCGHATATKVEMLNHRRGIISSCGWSRIKVWIHSLHTAWSK